MGPNEYSWCSKNSLFEKLVNNKEKFEVSPIEEKDPDWTLE